MTTPKIFIASYDVVNTTITGERQHTYLVFDADGDPTTTNDEQIIRGGPEDTPFAAGAIVLQNGMDLGSSLDHLTTGEDYITRNYTELTLSDTPEHIWAQMITAANALGSVSSTDVTTSIDYSLLGPNSGSVVATVLYDVGIDIVDQHARVGGTGDPIPLSQFTGANSYIGTAGDDVWDLTPNYTKIVVDQGGDDTYRIDVSALSSAHGVLTLIEKPETGSNNQLVLENVNGSDVGVFRDGNELVVTANGKIVGYVPDQYSTSDTPLLSNVHVVPSTGPPIDIPVGDPAGIPVFTPPAVPGWFPDVQSPFHDAPTQTSPLVIDLSSGHTGVTLSTFNASTTTTFFDIDGTGFASQTAWASGDTGLLARDLNSNGKIDDVGELFGSKTVDGFAKLAALDSNHDLKIDHNDDAWSSLVVWVDANHDAVTQDGELHSLDSLNIKSIDLAGVADSADVISGNTISHTSTVTFTNNATAAIDDAWFTHDPANTYYTGDYTLNAETMFLPDLRGFGQLPDLHIAMSLNGDLLSSVEDLATSFTMADFADNTTLDSAISNILYQWAGVDGVDPSSRGGYIDGRELGFMEKFFGENFLQYGFDWLSNPGGNASAELRNAWHGLFEELKADILLQTGAQGLFDGHASYNPWTAEIDGTLALDETAVGHLVDNAPSPGADNNAYWISIAEFISAAKGLDNLTTDENTWLNSAVHSSDSSLTWDDVKDMLPYVINGGAEGSTLTGTNGNDTINGGDGNDTIYGYQGADTIHAGAGHDYVDGGTDSDTIYGGDGDDELHGGSGDNHLYGEAGNDTLYGNEGGNNTLEGGTGGNHLYGGAGNDTYVYGGGDDWIRDSGGSDQILLPSGITAGDITITRVATSDGTFNDLLISIDGQGSIQIENQFYSGTGYHVETLVFSDSSTLNLTTLTGYETFLTSGDDNYSPGLSMVQVVHGMGGDDSIQTGSGNDTLDGGAGNDVLYGYAGNDTYIASPGFDVVNDTGGTDVINIPTGFSASDVSLFRHIGTYGPDNDLIVDIKGLGEIQISGQYDSSSYAIETIHFLSGGSDITLSGQTIETIGTTGNDYLTGLTGVAGNVFDGRGGSDSFYGGDGDNTFIISTGFGTTTIDENVNAGTNAINFVGVDPANIRMWTDFYGGLHLQDIGDTSHSITVSAAYTSASGTTYETSIDQYLEQITFDDAGHTVWDLTGGLNLALTNSGGSLYGSAHADTLTGGTGVDYLYGNGGNDTLAGGAGADNLYGGTGNDTYVFSSGFGNASVNENASEGTDTIHFTNIDPANIRMWTDVSGTLHIQDVADSSHNVSVYAGTTGNGADESTVGQFLEQISFDDLSHTLWDMTGGLNLHVDTLGDNLYGTAFGDTLTGSSAATTMYANGGDDTLYGAGGNDTLYGGDGADTFVFKAASALTGVAHIEDFSTGDGDKIDISDVLEGHYDPVHDAITDFVIFTTSGSNTNVSVDLDGTGTTHSPVQIATITGVTGLDVTTLVGDDHLIVHT